MKEVEETNLLLNHREDMSNTDSYSNHNVNSTTTCSSSLSKELKYEFLYHDVLDPSSYKDPFEKMTDNDIASYRIMSLLDSVGAPCYCYNKLITLLKKLSSDSQNIDDKTRILQRLSTYRKPNCM